MLKTTKYASPVKKAINTGFYIVKYSKHMASNIQFVNFIWLPLLNYDHFTDFIPDPFFMTVQNSCLFESVYNVDS